MDIRTLTPEIAIGPQMRVEDLPALADAGFRAVICNRPDGEGPDQPNFSEIERAARALGLEAVYLPALSGKVSDADGVAFGQALRRLPKPVLAYCRTGMRSCSMWALAVAGQQPMSLTVDRATRAGYDLSGLVRRIANGGKTPVEVAEASHDIVIIGSGAAGIATASSLLARDPHLDIAIIDPADVHYYQPGWTLVGAGVFDADTTARTIGSVLPRSVHWLKAAVAAFEPERNAVILDGCRVVRYKQLVVCPGLKLDWHGIEGLSETLGQNGVTSNYRFDLAPYTWQLVQDFKKGHAVFTQPPMPIKCAGAPQKALYLSCDHWLRSQVLKDMQVDFFNAGAVLFGVADYVPVLMAYVQRYQIGLNFGHTLTAVDGARKVATFSQALLDGRKEVVTTDFDFLHVVPPQKAPDFIRVSPLADAAGWVDVDPATLRHKKFDNLYALGDVTNTPNAKTAAAARKQAPVVAHNLLRGLHRGPSPLPSEARYDGYGSCPLTVERGKIVLAEFTYGGKLAPSFPSWLIDGTQPSSLAWLLKERILPPLYWEGMLKGREWLAHPEMVG